MSTTDNELSSLLTQLTRSSQSRGTVDALLGASLSQAGSLSSSLSDKTPSVGDARSSAIDEKVQPTGIKFGSASNSKTEAAQSGTDWGRLLQQTASGGLAGALSGSLGSIAGIGGIVTGLLSIFGGGKTAPPPLVRFQLPDAQLETVSFTSKGVAPEGGAPVQGSSTPLTTVYSPSQAMPSGSVQSTYITQVVKNALLNSSSLNDVITDL